MSMDAAKIVTSFVEILVMVLLCLSVTTSGHPSSSSGPPVAHDYSRRFAQVSRHCQSLLSSSTEELSVDADHAGLLIRHLSFTDADWSQDAGQAPLFPFHGSSADAAAAVAGPELIQADHLASFRLTQVQRRGAARATFNVSGLLTFTLTCNSGCLPMEPRASPELELWYGVAKSHTLFEGLYTETRPSDGGGGERVLCMVGNSALPTRGITREDLQSWAKTTDGGVTNVIEPPSTAGGNILLVLRYPMVQTLTTRAVRGEMTSLSAVSDGAYFDTVRLVSRLGPYSRYQFMPEHEELDAARCSSHPSFPDGVVAAGHLYRGASFCDILRQFTSDPDHALLALDPNWNCITTGESCSRPGPFDASGRATAMASTRSAVTVQDLRCEPACGVDGTAAAKVSAVFRFVAPWEDQATAAKRTGLSGATLSAEGAWSASTGRLCMAACLGAGEEACRYRVALHVPTAFSVTRRGIIVGQVTATDGSHPPLSFQQRVHRSGQNWHQFGRSGEVVPMAYHYTKVEQAGELLRASKRFGFRDNFIARSLLSYPKIAGAADELVSLSNLADDLRNLGFQSMPKLPFVPEWIEDSFNIELQILSVGTLVGSYSPPFEHGSSVPVEQSDRGHGVEKQQVILNVSAEFMAIRMYLGPIPVMSLEGVYNPEDGRMHLIGCRNVHAPWRVLSKSRDLEDGMDCSIEVTVEYPPTTMRWLMSPAAKVSIVSTREDNDPLHFTRTELQSMPVFYRDQRGVLTEDTMEDLLCIAMLSATVAATIIQLRHINSHAEVAPYVSLVMLGVQALGHGASLVTNAKMLPAWPRQSYKLYADHLECSVKALTLAALLLTAWLAHKVWWSRAQARARSSPLEPGRVPGDGAVLLCGLAVHLGVLAAHWRGTCGTSLTTTPPHRGTYAAEAQTMPSSSNMCSLGLVVERYAGVVREWFLLPQVIGNALWRVNCKPLAARYYAGVTAAWLLPHVYGYLRRPPGALYSEAGAVVVPGVGVVLALLVFVQQRWNYKVVCWATRKHRNKLPQHVY
ncbi:hypothetical protein BAE44_0021185 [Dichanthelium oligosanthes]|uniref:RING-type E3 ubiquitin transferase n=1 Tax=Dichanthelium oligosanthes TaxID=888268 RepID=A0A1E5UY31_9POAL|nr:hypothetical protein BAE44_0021185 [Dichanthelium oligosanthes]